MDTIIKVISLVLGGLMVWNGWRAITVLRDAKRSEKLRSDYRTQK